MASLSKFLLSNRRATSRAVLIGDRISTTGLDHHKVLSTTPLAFEVGDGVVTLFRCGVVVLTGLTAAEEQNVLDEAASHVRGTFQQREEETASIELSDERDEQIPPGGPICLKTLTIEHVLVIGEALAKSVVLARDELEGRNGVRHDRTVCA
jgi:required for meiotic nuclear division protein 1